MAHMKGTQRIVQFMKNSDVHSTTGDTHNQPVPEQTCSAKSTLETNSKTISTTIASSRLIFTVSGVVGSIEMGCCQKVTQTRFLVEFITGLRSNFEKQNNWNSKW